MLMIRRESVTEMVEVKVKVIGAGQVDMDAEEEEEDGVDVLLAEGVD